MVILRLGGNHALNEHSEFYPEFFSRVMAAVTDQRAAGPNIPNRPVAVEKPAFSKSSKPCRHEKSCWTTPAAAW
jgi:hypothetical protein